MESLDSLLKSGASESEIYASIEEYKEKFADYGRDRRSAIEFHLRNVERLLMPTQTTNVLVKTLQMSNHVHEMSSRASVSSESDETTGTVNAPVSGGGDEGLSAAIGTQEQPAAPAASAEPQTPSTLSQHVSTVAPSHIGTTQQPPPFSDMKSLFNHLVELLEVTPDQAAALKDSRFVAQEMDECLKNSLNVLGELRSRLLECGDSLESEFSTIRTILTPTQAAKFLVWVANNKACMHMLNELWDRVYFQHTDENNHTASGMRASTSSTDLSNSNTAAAGETTPGSANASPQ